MSELILAVDTTHEFGSIALASGATVLEETLLHAPDGFGHVLYAHLERLLARHGVSPDEISCFAAAAGPGSFTGVRIGLACVKGLAHATAKPAVGVSNLEALSTFGSAPLRAVLLDARRGEVYGAVYDAARRPVVPETVSKFAAWLDTVPQAAVEFIGMDLTPFASALAGRRLTTVPRAIAGAIAAIACERLQRGEAGDPAALDANYVRRSDAELFWKEA